MGIGERMRRGQTSAAATAQSEMAAFFGLGTSTVADQITITFPSGVQQVHENVTMGSHAFTE